MAWGVRLTNFMDRAPLFMGEVGRFFWGSFLLRGFLWLCTSGRGFSRALGCMVLLSDCITGLRKEKRLENTNFLGFLNSEG